MCPWTVSRELRSIIEENNLPQFDGESEHSRSSTSERLLLFRSKLANTGHRSTWYSFWTVLIPTVSDDCQATLFATFRTRVVFTGESISENRISARLASERGRVKMYTNPFNRKHSTIRQMLDKILEPTKKSIMRSESVCSAGSNSSKGSNGSLSRCSHGHRMLQWGRKWTTEGRTAFLFSSSGFLTR